LSDNGKAPRERAHVLATIQHAVLHDEEGGKRYPTLFDLLSPRFKDGKQTRVPGVLTLTVEGSVYRVTVRCDEEGLECKLTCETLHDIVKRVEQLVASSHTVWSLTYAAKKKLDTR